MIKQNKNENKRKIINWILNILIIIFIILGIYLFFTKIFGASPTDFQLILWLFGFFGTAILKVFTMLYGINREIGELKISVKESFQKIKKDICNIPQNLKKLKR